MASFADSAGRKWAVGITYGIIRQARKQLEIDLMAVFEDETVLQRLSVDTELLYKLALLATAKQRAEYGISEDDFADLLDADAAEALGLAVAEAVADFFPAPKRAPLKAALRKANQALEKMGADLAEELDRLPLDSTPSFGSSPE